MAKQKVYSGVIYRPRHPASSKGQVRYVVAATSYRSAAEKLGTTVHEVRRYGSETGNKRDIEVALAHGVPLVFRGSGAREWFDLDGNPVTPARPRGDTP